MGEDSVGDDDTLAMMYEILAEGQSSVWSLVKPDDKEGVVVKGYDCRVHAGDTQSMSFGNADTHPPPPFYALNAPLDTIPDVDPVSGNQKTTKGGKAKVIEGYAGQAKGMKQILWERGLWREGMKGKLDSDDPSYPDMSALAVLANCEDFRQETGAMEDLVASYGNIVLFSPKGHPEIAGAGIEYDWGVSKKIFRRTTNHVAKDCERDVRSSLAKVTLPIAKHTARKARSYMRAYMSGAGDSHLLIEKFVKICKCHRNILDQETAYLEKMIRTIAEHLKEVEEERASLLAEKVAEEDKEVEGEKQDTAGTAQRTAANS